MARSTPYQRRQQEAAIRKQAALKERAKNPPPPKELAPVPQLMGVTLHDLRLGSAETTIYEHTFDKAGMVSKVSLYLSDIADEVVTLGLFLNDTYVGSVEAKRGGQELALPLNRITSKNRISVFASAERDLKVGKLALSFYFTESK